jgi:hypothetical protein
VKPPRFEPPRVEPPRFEPPRVEPPRFEQPRMEPPCFGQPQFEHPRMEPLQQRIGQPEAGFRFEQPQKFGPIRKEPYKEQFRFEQPYDQRGEFRNEPPRNEPYRPP